MSIGDEPTTHPEWDYRRYLEEGPMQIGKDLNEAVSLAHAEAERRRNAEMRQFASGATRDSDEGKLDYEGFLSPVVLRRFAEYMDEHRHCADGSLRDSDNWQRGIPVDQYLKSLIRHVFELWTLHRANHPDSAKTFEDIMCAIMFNIQGMLFEYLRERD